MKRYHPSFTDAEIDKEHVHIGMSNSPDKTTWSTNLQLHDHCLEYLREVSLCRGDVSITTFGWRGGLPTAKFSSEHECINWEALAGWAGKRSVDLLDYGILTKSPRNAA